MIDVFDITVITVLGLGIAALIYAIVVLHIDKDVDDEDLKEDK